MNKTDLRSLYVRDLAKTPEVLDLIRQASTSAEKTARLDFDTFSDDPIRLYAACALAHSGGIAVLLTA